MAFTPIAPNVATVHSPSTLAYALAFARHGYAVFPVTWPIEHRGRLVCSCGSDSRGKPCTAPAKHPFVKLAPNGVHSSTA
jgi:hypothetical protein